MYANDTLGDYLLADTIRLDSTLDYVHPFRKHIEPVRTIPLKKMSLQFVSACDVLAESLTCRPQKHPRCQTASALQQRLWPNPRKQQAMQILFPSDASAAAM